VQGESFQQLLLRIREKDITAFNELYYRLAQGLLRTAIVKTNDPYLADDLVQELFIWLWEHGPRMDNLLQEDFDLRAYLNTALKNKVYDHFRRQLLKETITTDIQRSETPVVNDSEGRLINKEIESAITEEIEALPRGMKKIYDLSRNRQMTIKEIASLLSLSEQTVKNQLTNAIKRLRFALSKINCWFF
jgi:RNA polymerase sigma-19 factor, ECF subfamily